MKYQAIMQASQEVAEAAWTRDSRKAMAVVSALRAKGFVLAAVITDAMMCMEYEERCWLAELLLANAADEFEPVGGVSTNALPN